MIWSYYKDHKPSLQDGLDSYCLPPGSGWSWPFYYQFQCNPASSQRWRSSRYPTITRTMGWSRYPHSHRLGPSWPHVDSDTIKEAKTLMLDPSLAGPLGLVADVSSLKQHGVEKMFWLEPASPAFISKNDTTHTQAQTKAGLKSVNAPTKSVVYICRPEIKWMKAIAGKLLLLSSFQTLLPLSLHCISPYPPHHHTQSWTKLAEPTRSLQR